MSFSEAGFGGSMQAVVFDLFETLVTELNVPVRRAGALASQLGVDAIAYKREWRLRRQEIVLGRCSFRDVLRQIASELGGVADEAVLDDLRAERIAQKAAVLGSVEPEIPATLSELRRRGLKLGLVTNAFAEDVQGWDQSPLRACVDATVFSCAVGLAKPDPAIYLAACQTLGVTPQHALFVGDGGDDELSGAKRAGLATTRALWLASQWPNTTIGPADPGLRRIGEVVGFAVATIPLGEQHWWR